MATHIISVSDSELDILISGVIAVRNSINFDLTIASTDNEIATVMEIYVKVTQLLETLEDLRCDR